MIIDTVKTLIANDAGFKKVNLCHKMIKAVTITV